MNAERWQQVKAIFHGAVECDPATRVEFLRKSCGSDEPLRREVESLLESAEDPGSLLENPVIETAAIKMAAPARGSRSILGRTIGNYVITGELARGGMGIVYRARHVTLPRDAVVKCIRALALTEEEQNELRARFRREAHIQCQLDHPHIVRVYEFFDLAEEYFLVMEYVPGSSVRSMLDTRGRLPAEQAATLAVQALEGLAHAHGLHYVDESGNSGVGIIHRDIKPGNLLVDEQGNLKLADFGIAKVRGEGQLTKTGSTIGTVEYMSPEQIRGLPVAARSDLYSLGATLYEMLTGRVPFPRADTDSGYDLLKAHVETDPPPIQTLNPDIPLWLADAVTRSLNRNPEERWQKAADFRAALLGHQTSIELATPAKPVSRRHLIAAGLAALALVVAGAGLWSGRAGKENTSIAVLPFEDLSLLKDQEPFSDGLAEELLDGLAKIPGLRVVGRTSSFQFKGKNEDSRVIGRKLNVATILEGSVRKQANQVRISAQLVQTTDGSNLWSESYQREMNDLFAVQEDIAHAVTRSLKVRLIGDKAEATPAKPPKPEAYTAYLQGQYFRERRTKASLEKAIGYFEQAIQLDPDYAPAWVGLGLSRSAQADTAYVSTGLGYREAREAVEQALKLNENLGEAHAAMGWIEMGYDRDWKSADASYKRALALQPGSATVISGAASLEWHLGQWDKAIALYRRALEIDPLKFIVSLNIADVLYYAGRYEESKAAIMKLLELAPEVEVAHGLLGRVYLVQSHAAEALAEAEREKHDVFHLAGLALAYHALRRKRESDKELAELIAKFGGDAPYAIADVFAYRGEANLAFEWLQRAYNEHDAGLNEIKGDPLLKNLERDPRYAALLTNMHLPL